jgi:hypothetical protein
MGDHANFRLTAQSEINLPISFVSCARVSAVHTCAQPNNPPYGMV